MFTSKMPGLTGLVCCAIGIGCVVAPGSLAASTPAPLVKTLKIEDLPKSLRGGTTVLVTFAFGTAELDQAARDALDVQARYLARNKRLTFTVTGSADSVGSSDANPRWVLPARRWWRPT